MKQVIPPGIALRAVPDPTFNSLTSHLERSVSGVDRACLALARARRAGRSLVYEILRFTQNDQIEIVTELVD